MAIIYITILTILAGIFGIGGSVRSAFLSVFDLPKAIYITTGGIALFIDSSRLITYIQDGTRLETQAKACYSN